MENARSIAMLTLKVIVGVYLLKKIAPGIHASAFTPSASPSFDPLGNFSIGAGTNTVQ